MRTFLSKTRATAAAALAVAVLAGGSGVAFALLSSATATQTSTVAAATLASPTNGGSGTVTKSSIPLTWSAPAGTPSYAPTGYIVYRCQGTCTPTTAIAAGSCASSVTTASTATSCTDNDPGLASATTYTYAVAAAFHNWTSTRSATFQATTAGPQVTTPNSGSPLDCTPLNPHCDVTMTVSGSGFQSGATITSSAGSSAVQFGSVTWVSASSIQVDVTGKQAGTYDFTVTNPDGSAVTCSGCIHVH